MPVIEHPTITRTASEVGHAFLSKGFVALLLWSLTIFALVAGIATGNRVALYGWLGAMVIYLFWMFFLFVILGPVKKLIHFYWLWLREGVERGYAWKTSFPERQYRSSSEPLPTGAMLAFFGPMVASIFVSVFIFAGPKWTTADTAYVVARKTTARTGIVMGIPFVDTIRSIDGEHKVTAKASGVTADGVKVLGTIEMNMHFDLNDRNALLRMAAQYKNPNTAIDEAVTKVLQAQFWAAVAKRKVADLQPIMSLEYDTGRITDQQALAAVGVRPQGTIAITDLHPFFGK